MKAGVVSVCLSMKFTRVYFSCSFYCSGQPHNFPRYSDRTPEGAKAVLFIIPSFKSGIIF